MEYNYKRTKLNTRYWGAILENESSNEDLQYRAYKYFNSAKHWLKALESPSAFIRYHAYKFFNTSDRWKKALKDEDPFIMERARDFFINRSFNV